MAEDVVVNPAVVEPPPDPGDGTIEVKLEDGEVYRGTPDQVIEQLKKGKEETNRFAKAQTQELTSIRKLIEERGVGDRKPDQPAGMKDEEWYRLLATDRRKALEIGMAEILGVDPKELAPTLQSIKETLGGFTENAEIARFYGSVGLEEPLGQETSALILDRIKADGLEPNANSYELAYSRLQREGKIKREEPPAKGGRRPPPNLRGTGTDTTVSAEDAWTMPIEKLRKQAGIGQE